MFNTVWFYVLLYVVTGVAAIVVSEKIHKEMGNKLWDLNCMRAWDYNEQSLIAIKSKALYNCYAIIALVIWPIGVSVAMVKRIVVYRRIKKAELEDQKTKKMVEELIKRWTVR